MSDDAYEVVGGSLKLKGVKDGGVKKKLENCKILGIVKVILCRELVKIKYFVFNTPIRTIP